MKTKLILLTTIILILALCFAACSELSSIVSQDGTSSTSSPSEGTTTVTEEEIAAAAEQVKDALSDVEEVNYLDSDLVAIDEAQEITAVTEDAVEIDLSSLTEESVMEGASYASNVLTIKQAGTYVLSGTLNGSVVVAKKINDTVRIVLNGATIKTLDSQDSAAIVFSQTDALRILTVADGTVNEVSDSVGDTAEDGDGAAIQAKKSSLTINGTGTLKVTAVGEEANGIKVKDTLTILSTTLEVTAVKNGIKADNVITIKDATITVTAGNDGIKTDIEPEAAEATDDTPAKTAEEVAEEYATDPTAGYIYIQNSTITVTAGDDGIAANSCLYIDNRAEDVITVTTNGGAPSTVTEKSSDAADGKALKVGGIVLEDEEGNETLYPANYAEDADIDNYALVITGGTFVINANDDAIHSKGNVLITGGTFTIASGDDGVHAEYLTKITGGKITVTKGYEGIEGASVEVTGGEISINVVDDGVNAANADLKNYDYNIVVTGGTLTVNCSGDGLDSNGKLLISGGTVTVFGPANGGNSALDSESGTTISGGTVITTCREAMDPVGSTQYKVVANVSVSAGTAVTLKDASGTVIASFTAPKACANILISTPQMTAGTYTLTYGNNTTTLTATVGSTGGMGFGGMQGGMQGGQPGGMQGGQPGGKQPGGFGQRTGVAEGEMPSLSDGETPQDGDLPPEMPQGEIPPTESLEPPTGEAPFSLPQDGENGCPPSLPGGQDPAFGGRGPMMPQGGAFGAPFGDDFGGDFSAQN